MTVMPTRCGGHPGEVNLYLDLVTWMIRFHADEAFVATLVAKFNQARQETGEDEMSFAERLRHLNTACGFLHSSGAHRDASSKASTLQLGPPCANVTCPG